MTITKSGKKFLLALCSLLLASFISGCSNPEVQKAEDIKLTNKAQNSKIIVLDVYHNRCESCKQIEPVMKQLEENYSQNPDIAFLKYDLSNPFTIFRSRKIAKQLGLEDIYKLQRYSGVVLVIDTKSKQVLETLIAEYNIEKYNEVIEKTINQ